jgi:predicted phosphohydrolase
MKLHILSDIHLEFWDFELPQTDADVIILAGDTAPGMAGIKWAKNAFYGKPVIYINGNHEYYRNTYPKLIQKMREFTSDPGIVFLENDAFVVDDVQILGCTLWTDFNLHGNAPIAVLDAQMAMNDFKLIRNSKRNYSRLHPNDTRVAFRESIYWLEGRLKQPYRKTVVITHHAPSIHSIDKEYRNHRLAPAFASDLSGFILANGPDLWIHGHIHRAVDYHIGETRIICNPRGYPGEKNTGFTPGLVVEI